MDYGAKVQPLSPVFIPKKVSPPRRRELLPVGRPAAPTCERRVPSEARHGGKGRGRRTGDTTPFEGSPQDVRPFQWSQPGEAGAKDQRTQEEGICTASSWHQNSSPLPPCSQASWDEGTTRTMSVGTTARLLTFVFGAMCSVSFLYKRPLRYQQSVGLLNQGTVHKPEEKNKPAATSAASQAYRIHRKRCIPVLTFKQQIIWFLFGFADVIS